MIAFAQILQETDSFNPVVTTLEDFGSNRLLEGRDMLSQKWDSDGNLIWTRFFDYLGFWDQANLCAADLRSSSESLRRSCSSSMITSACPISSRLMDVS